MDSVEKLTAAITLVEEARGVPLSASCVVHRAEMLEILDEARESLPTDFESARKIIDTREAIIEEVVETTTTIAPEIAKRDQMLIPIQTKFPCGNFRANPDDPKSIIGSRKNGANYEVVVPPDLRENFIYLLNQVNTLLKL